MRAPAGLDDGRRAPPCLHAIHLRCHSGIAPARPQFTAAFHLLFGGALAASIRDPAVVLYGGVDGWRSTDGGRSFERINSWQDYYDRPGDQLHADINSLHFLLYRGQEVLFLGTDGGTYQSLDGGATVRNLTQVGLPIGQFYATWSSGSDPDLFLAGSQDQGLQTAPPYTTTSSLLAATGDPLTCFAGGSGYGGPPVLVTRDGGATWSPLDNGMPSTLVWSLAFDNPTSQTLYAATEAGPFVFDAAAGTWRSLIGGGAPVGRYYSVEGVPAAGVVRFGTFSRGIWDYVPPARRGR